MAVLIPNERYTGGKIPIFAGLNPAIASIRKAVSVLIKSHIVVFILQQRIPKQVDKRLYFFILTL